MLFCSALGCGQYEERRGYEPSIARYVAAGAFARRFEPRSGNPTPDSLVIRYTRVMPFLMFRQGPLDLVIGYTRYDLGGSSRAAVYLGSTYSSDLPLAGEGERGAALVLPLVVAADYTKSESAGSDRDDFNVASVGIGAGLKFRLMEPSYELAVSGAGIIHFSFEGYNFRNGSSPAVVGEAWALFRDVPILRGIALGYRYRYQSWSAGGKFDYTTVNHGAYVGVMF
jgi:hypothetical protein